MYIYRKSRHRSLLRIVVLLWCLLMGLRTQMQAWAHALPAEWVEQQASSGIWDNQSDSDTAASNANSLKHYWLQAAEDKSAPVSYLFHFAHPLLFLFDVGSPVCPAKAFCSSCLPLRLLYQQILFRCFVVRNAP